MSDKNAEIDRLISEYKEAVEDEEDAASRVATLAQELEDLGVNPEDVE